MRYSRPVCDRTSGLSSVLLLLVLPLLWLPPAAAEDDGPSRLELDGARHRLEKFEERVHRAHGQAIPLGHDGTEALRRIKALHEKYPNHPEVQRLFERAGKTFSASKGESTALPENVLAYRENEKRMAQLFFEVAEKEWNAYREKALGTDNAMAKAFPAPSPQERSLDEMRGRYVVLEDFRYPTNEFMDVGQQFVHVGSGTRGYYFVELGNRSWLGAHEALKRYRRFINSDVPEGGPWTVVGRIETVRLLIPQAGELKRSLTWGWSVVPEAIFVADRTFAVADPDLELGGRFAGEDRTEEIKAPLYTVRSIPDDVTPQRLTEIYATAIKEKNYPLYLDCIDPDRRKTNKALQLCMYHWELHQGRFARFYCHVVVSEPDIFVIRGFDANDEFGLTFLPEEERKRLEELSGPLVERAELKSTVFDERGRQYGSPPSRGS